MEERNGSPRAGQNGEGPSRKPAAQSEVNQLLKQNEVLMSLIKISNQNLTLNQVSELIIKELIRIFKVDRGLLFLAKRDGPLEFVYGCDSAGNRLPENVFQSSTILEKVRRDRKSIAMTGNDEFEALGARSMMASELRSVVACPLIFKNKLTGILTLDSKVNQAVVGESEVRLIESVAAQLASTIDHANTTTQLNTLFELAMGSELLFDPERQALAALDQVIRLTGAQRAFLFAFDEGTETLKSGIGINSAGEVLSELSNYSKTTIDKVRSTQQALTLASTEDGRELGSHSAVAHNLRSVMAAPIRFNHRFYGVLYLDSQITNGLFTPEDLVFLSGIANHLSVILESARTAKIEIDRLKLGNTLELTRSIQSLLLPKQSYIDEAEFSLAGSFNPVDASGGDWWTWEKISTGHYLIALADVTGHGVASAMVTAALTGIFRSGRKLGKSGTVLLKTMNTGLHEVCQGNYWATMILVEIDTQEKRINWWNAAGPDPVMLREEAKLENLVSGQSSPLGSASSDILTVEGTTSFQSGHAIFIFTDGIEEMALPKNRMMGSRGIRKLLQKIEFDSAINMRTQILSHIEEIRHSEPRNDDETFVIVQFK